jgi:hypothetical protein
VRRHLCGVLDNDDNRGSISIAIFPKITQEERENYIKIEEAAQRMNTKNKRFNLMHLLPFHLLHLVEGPHPVEVEVEVREP